VGDVVAYIPIVVEAHLVHIHGQSNRSVSLARHARLALGVSNVWTAVPYGAAQLGADWRAEPSLRGPLAEILSRFSRHPAGAADAGSDGADEGPQLLDYGWCCFYVECC